MRSRYSGIAMETERQNGNCAEPGRSHELLSNGPHIEDLFELILSRHVHLQQR